MQIAIGLAVALVLLGGIGWYGLSQNKTEMDESIVAMQEKDSVPSNELTMTKEREDGGAMMEKKMEPKESTDSMMKPKDDASTNDVMQGKGSYETYAPEKLARATEGDVVLFFRASWCPTCRGLDSDIKSNAGKIPAGVTILDVDYDNSATLKQKYGVTYQHTLVQVDAKGNQIAKWQGSPTLAKLLEQVK
jgi:thiol-disulfide isomerase/thioredoxin